MRLKPARLYHARSAELEHDLRAREPTLCCEGFVYPSTNLRSSEEYGEEGEVERESFEREDGSHEVRDPIHPNAIPNEVNHNEEDDPERSRAGADVSPPHALPQPCHVLGVG